MNFDWLDWFNKVATNLAILGAAYFTYIKYVKGRTYKVRIKPELSWKLLSNGDTEKLCITARITNDSTFATRIPEKGFYVVISESVYGDKDVIHTLQWNRIAAFRVFVESNVLEVGETDSEEIVASFPDGKFATLKLQLIVWTEEQKPPFLKNHPTLVRWHNRWNPIHDPGSSFQSSCIVDMSSRCQNDNHE